MYVCYHGNKTCTSKFIKSYLHVESMQTEICTICSVFVPALENVYDHVEDTSHFINLQQLGHFLKSQVG